MKKVITDVTQADRDYRYTLHIQQREHAVYDTKSKPSVQRSTGISSERKKERK
jgi:hypothetical protein